MQENWGYLKLARYTRAESIDEMRHAEMLTDRILFLDGFPNFQRLFPLNIGQDLREMFAADLGIETAAVDRLRRGTAVMRDKTDLSSARRFKSVIEDEESHIDYLETQLALLDKVGEQLYIAELLEQPDDS